jgi:hypothetical protein
LNVSIDPVLVGLGTAAGSQPQTETFFTNGLAAGLSSLDKRAGARFFIGLAKETNAR